MIKTYKLLLAISIFLLFIVAIVTPAFAADVTVAISNTSPNPGDIITFTINSNGNYAILGNGAVTGPLSFMGSNAASSSANNQMPPTIIWSGNGGSFLGVNNPIFTLTYRVNANAQPGEPFSINLTGIEASNANGEIIPAAVTSTAAGAVYSPPTPSPSVSASPSPSRTTSASPSASGATSASPSGSGNLDNTPKTGDATVDVWMALAPIIILLVFLAIKFGKSAFSKQ